MIPEDRLGAALDALHQIILRARFLAYDSGMKVVGDLLDDAELVPELLAAPDDKTEEFRELLESISLKYQELSALPKFFDAPALATSVE